MSQILDVGFATVEASFPEQIRFVGRPDGSIVLSIAGGELIIKPQNIESALVKQRGLHFQSIGRAPGAFYTPVPDWKAPSQGSIAAGTDSERSHALISSTVGKATVGELLELDDEDEDGMGDAVAAALRAALAPYSKEHKAGNAGGPAGASPADIEPTGSKERQTKPAVKRGRAVAGIDSSSQSPAPTSSISLPHAGAGGPIKRSRPGRASVPVLELGRLSGGAGNVGGSLPTAFRDPVSSSASSSLPANEQPTLLPTSYLLACGEEGYVSAAQLKAKVEWDDRIARLLTAPSCTSARTGLRTLPGLALVSIPTPSSPSARWGHAAVLLDDRRMLVYGGADGAGVTLSDCWILDLVSARWSAVPCSVEPPARAWHSLVQVPGRSWTVAVGEQEGEEGASTGRGSGEEGEGECEEVSIIDPDVGLFYSPILKGKAPCKRKGHCTVLVPSAVLPGAGAHGLRAPEPAMIVWGGLREGGSRSTWLNDIHAWPVGHSEGAGKFTWHCVRNTEGRQPPPRCYHAAVAVGERMVVFGGNNGDNTFCDVAYLQCTPTVSSPDCWSWHWPALRGGGPRPRTGCTAVAIGARYMLVLGGWDEDESGSAAQGRRQAKGKPGQSGSVHTLPAPAPAYDSERRIGSPFAEAWLCDMEAGGVGREEQWEWIRIDPAVVGGTSSLPSLLGRAGLSAVVCPDVTALLASAAGSGDEGARTCLAAAGGTPMPGVLMFGGLKGAFKGPIEGGEGAHFLDSDTAVLVLPPQLTGAGWARRDAQAAARAEFRAMAAEAPRSPLRGIATGAGLMGGSGSALALPAHSYSLDAGLPLEYGLGGQGGEDEDWDAVLRQPNPTQEH